MSEIIAKYDDVKALMNTGDLVEFRHDGFIAAEIRRKTGYDTNHTAIIVIMQSPYTKVIRRYLHEAVNTGIEIHYLSDIIKYGEGEAFWYPVRDAYKLQIPAVEERALSYIGVKYDYEGLVKQLFGHCKIDTSTLFCSEYCEVCWGGTNQDTAWWPGEIIDKMQLWKLPRIQLEA